MSLHLVSPLSKGLFHRAIMQSGASSSPLYCGKVTNKKQLEVFAKRINCSLGPDLVDCVRGKTVEEITKAKSGITISKSIGSQNIVGPTVDGEFLPDLPETLFKTGQFHADVQVITGVTSNEGALFAMIMPRYQVKDGVSLEMFESVVRNGMIYGRQKRKLVEDLTLFHYTNHADPNNRIAVRQSMMNCFSDSGFIAPLMLEAKALAKVIFIFRLLPYQSVGGPYLRSVLVMCPCTEKGKSFRDKSPHACRLVFGGSKSRRLEVLFQISLNSRDKPRGQLNAPTTSSFRQNR